VGVPLLGAHDGELQLRLATDLATGLRALTVGGVEATALAAWLALRRWHAVALAVMAPAATFVVDRLLKPLVACKAPGSLVFHYPSGHVAVATALALSLVLILRPSMVRPRVKTAHLLTDVAGGVSAGVAVTLAAALLLDHDGRSVQGGLIELHPQGLGEVGVRRADRERQRPRPPRSTNHQ
jgi:membrane-associated phospholipid phosphatase